ncbi:MAG: sugar phosphate isomerase/epimerase family protein [Sphaerochaetaceae bacterium]
MGSTLKLAGMTNIFQAQRDSKERTPIIECMRRLKAFGYEYMDLGVAYLMFDNPDITDDNWYGKACEIRNEAEKLGIEFVQGHLPFRKKAFNPMNQEEYDYLHSATMRAIKIAGICGAQWMVAHPVEAPDFPEEAIEEHVKENLRVYEDVVEEAMKSKVGITFENIPRWGALGRFGSTASDLCAVIDAFGNPKIQACWDFGHANMTYGKLQTYGIEKLGSCLKTVHVQDNKGVSDDHYCPYAGNIKWEDIFKSLKKIGFDGYWVFEVILQNNFPDYLKDTSVRFTTEIAKSMISEYNAMEL